MTDFADLASRVPLHDPSVCTRVPCGKCRPHGKAQPPKPVDHEVARSKGTVSRLGGVTPQQLHLALTDLAKTIDRHGQATWQHVDDWRKQRRLSSDSNRGGGAGDHAAARAADRIEDERVGHLFDRLTQAVTDLSDMIARTDALITETIPLRVPKAKPNILAAQAAADGWCRSCFRDDQHLEPITLRPDGTPFFRDLCKWCGYWQAEHGQLPGVDVLRQRHEGRRIRRAT
jgi:hypothetical protein